MTPFDVMVVEKERWTRQADSEGAFLITVDFGNNATLFVHYILRFELVWGPSQYEDAVLLV